MNICKNCNEPVHGNYCSNCGTPTHFKRIDGRYILSEIAGFFHAKKGWIFTLKRMLLSPGESVRQYITENRNHYIKPIVFVIVTSLTYTLVCHFFQIDYQTFQTQLSGETDQEVLPTQLLLTNWIIDHNGYATIITGLFMAFWLKLFFRKSAYNLFELFVLMCYLSGIVSIFSSILFIIQGVANLHLISVTLFVTMIYYIWAIGQFFEKKKAGIYIKAFFAYLLGVLTVGILVGFVAIFVDLILKR
ncbi:MAG: DUF3667 domain-containing protein [Lentimicrobiaceae bacterium]|nr:DUF3667 domain-containing protein [Lentimicrobiaceae bacterium]